MASETADDDGYASFRLGYDLHVRGEVGRAEAAYRQAIEAGQSDAWLHLGLLLEPLRGRERETELAFRAATQSPTPAVAGRAAAELGHLLWRRGDRAGAYENFAFARQQDTTEGRQSATLGLAHLLAEDGDPAAAATLYREFVTVYFSNTDVDLGERGVQRLAHGFAALGGTRTGRRALRALRSTMYRQRRVRRRLRPGCLRARVRRSGAGNDT